MVSVLEQGANSKSAGLELSNSDAKISSAETGNNFSRQRSRKNTRDNSNDNDNNSTTRNHSKNLNKHRVQHILMCIAALDALKTPGQILRHLEGRLDCNDVHHQFIIWVLREPSENFQKALNWITDDECFEFHS